MRILAVLGLAVLAAAGAGQGSAQDSPAERVALAFCAAVRAGDTGAAEALMTPALRSAIAQLQIADAAFRSAHPEDKPPLGDGLRLAGFPDAAETCVPEEVTATGAVLAYVPQGAPDGAWRDRLILEPGPDGAPLIADIVFAPGPGDRFSTWLAESAGWK